MAKLLSEIVGKSFYPKNGDEQRFWDKHVVTLFKNIYSAEEYDKLFKGSNIKMVDREKERHGYNPGNDEKVYESVEQLDENQTLARLLDHSTFLAKKHGHKVGHVAQAIVDASKTHGVSLHDVMDFGPQTFRNSTEFHSQMDKHLFGRGNSSIAKMKHKNASMLLKSTFERHLSKHKKKDSVFDHLTHKELSECYLSQITEDHIAKLKHHNKAMELTSKELGLPISLIAAAGVHYSENPGIPTYAGKAEKHIRDTFHKHYTDSQEGIHEHSNGQLDNSVSLQHSKRKREEQIAEEDSGREHFSRSSRVRLSNDSELREREQEITENSHILVDPNTRKVHATGGPSHIHSLRSVSKKFKNFTVMPNHQKLKVGQRVSEKD